MKTLQITALLLISVLSFSSCVTDGSLICTKAQGDKNLVEYNVENFSSVELQMDAEVILTQGEEFKVEVEATDNIHNILVANVSGQELTLRTQRGKCIRGRSEVVFYITCPSLDGITLAGSGSIENTNQFDGEMLDVNLSGSGSIDLENMFYQDVITSISGSGQVNLNAIEAATFESKISGSGDIEVLESNINILDLGITGSGSFKIEGNEAEELSANISGSGKLNAQNMPASAVTVKIGGSGGASVNSLNELKVNITGSGNVHYTGSPSIDANITGSGKLINDN